MKTQIATGTSSVEDAREAGAGAATEAANRLDADRVDFCHVFCSPDYDYERTLDGIRSVIGTDASLLGASSSGEFTETAVTEGGVALALVTSDTLQFFTGFGTGLEENIPMAVSEAVADLPDGVEGYPYLSAITLHDGLAGVGEQLALVTQRKLGPKVSFVGGAASDGYRMEATHVFCDDRIAEDAVGIALIASQERPVVTIDHGHEPISDPMVVTATEDNVVYELDGRAAYEAWADAVRDPVDDLFGVDIDDFDEVTPQHHRIMGEFEFGIDQGDDYKIRWPQVADIDGGSIEFAVDIPEGTTFRVMYGSPDAQVDSARSAAREAVDIADGRAMAGGFVYDCACREIILGDRFGEAVDAMADVLDMPFVGFETYGEMCMQVGEMSGFHNTTSVVLLLPE